MIDDVENFCEFFKTSWIREKKFFFNFWNISREIEIGFVGCEAVEMDMQ